MMKILRLRDALYPLLAAAVLSTTAGCSKVKGLFSKKSETPAVQSETSSSAPTPPPAGGDRANPAVTPAPTPVRVSAPTINKSAAVIVLCYHRLEDKPRPKDEYAITPGEFEKELQQVKDAGFTVIKMQDFLAWRRGDKDIPSKSAVITIDDGYVSGYDTAWPILKKFGFPFTMFVYVNYINSGGKSVSWDQLAEMRDAGVDIQCHSFYHSNLHSPGSGVDKPTHDKVVRDIQTLGADGYLRKEVIESKQILEKQLGIKVNCIAYPYGNYTTKVRELVKEAGYEAGFTVYGQRIAYSTAFDILGRYAVEQNNAKIFQDALAMQGGGGGGPLPNTSAMAQFAGTSMLTVPAQGETISNPKPLIKANVAAMGEVDSKSIEMRISGLGLVPVQYDEKTKTVSYQVTQPLRDKNYSVILTALVGGKRAETRWDFNFDPKATGSRSPDAKATMFSQLGDKLQDIFKDLRGHGSISETNVTDAMRQVRLALLEADVHFQVAKTFIARVREKALGQEVLRSVTPGQQIVKIFYDELTTLLGGDAEPLKLDKPGRIMMVGLNGAGKTTSSAKLAKLLKKQGRSPVLIACDLHRPAAIDQLVTLAGQIGVPVFRPSAGETDLLKVGREAAAWAAEQPGANVQIYDTAGRQEVDEPLVQELKRLRDFLQPQEVLLVADAATGQQAVSVATHFDTALGITGLVLTKLDGDARGGAALSMREVTHKPIKFAGVGEKLDQFEPFYPERLAGRILGMGDIVGLVEKAAEAIDEDEARRMEEKLRTASFDFEDFLNQMRFIKKLGPLENVFAMLPGMSQMKDLPTDGKELKRAEAIVLSMTFKERRKPELLDARRRRRVAAGSGTSVTEVNDLLQRFQQMRKMMKNMGKMKKMLGRMGGGMPGMPAGGRLQ